MVRTLKNRNFWIMLIGDACLLFCAYYLAHYLRFDGDIPADFVQRWQYTFHWIIPLKLSCFFLFRSYRGMWRYTSIHDMINLFKACITSSALIIFILAISIRLFGYSRGVFAIDFILTLIFIGGFRLSVRLYLIKGYSNGIKQVQNGFSSNRKRILIVGAGSAGEKLLREILEHKQSQYYAVGFLDDNQKKIGQAIHGITVLGSIADNESVIEQQDIDELIIAIPSATAAHMRTIVSMCESTELPFRTVPSLYDIAQGKVSLSSVRDVRYEDLLGRVQVNLDDKEIGEYIAGKRILVSGGAGSIGSELCRQITKYRPESLIVFDQNESGINDLEVELKTQYPRQKIVSILGSLHSDTRIRRLFNITKPHVVFHAAAYKHVPMMEYHPWEAVHNNILGTRSILELCSEYDVEKCVIVSTDKAVRPTSIMGASKRVIELLTQAYAMMNNGAYMAVRFGNVIGSAGSVLPLFKKQIESGGPVTVTHPDATRYFMTMPEASGLILQSGAIGRGGDIFLLKMGIPVRISDMAKDMITLSGLKPDTDIRIEYIGLRPGEKLVEELISDDEEIQETAHKDLMLLKTNGFRSLQELNISIDKLAALADLQDAVGIKEELIQIVPEYKPQ